MGVDLVPTWEGSPQPIAAVFTYRDRFTKVATAGVTTYRPTLTISQGASSVFMEAVVTGKDDDDDTDPYMAWNASMLPTNVDWLEAMGASLYLHRLTVPVMGSRSVLTPSCLRPKSRRARTAR